TPGNPRTSDLSASCQPYRSTKLYSASLTFILIVEAGSIMGWSRNADSTSSDMPASRLLPSCAASVLFNTYIVRRPSLSKNMPPNAGSRLATSSSCSSSVLPFDWSMSADVDACCAAAGSDDSTPAAIIARAIPVAQIARDFIVWVPWGMQPEYRAGQEKELVWTVPGDQRFLHRATPELQLTLPPQSGTERLALLRVHQRHRPARPRVFRALAGVVHLDPRPRIASVSRVERAVGTTDHIHKEHDLIVATFDTRRVIRQRFGATC